jgi:DNA-binding transcriptional LysR family regulator
MRDKGDRRAKIASGQIIEGPLAFNSISINLSATLAGLGLAYLPEDVVREHVTAGRLVRVLADWSAVMTGYHLYYPNRQPSPAFALLVKRYGTLRGLLIVSMSGIMDIWTTNPR